MTAYTSIFNTPPSGTNYLIGDTVTLTGGDVWKYAGNGQWVADAMGQMQVAAIGIPFVLPPGDGVSVGLQFTNNLGAFTLSAAILANLWNALKGCWIYLPNDFVSSGYPADWYWAVFTSDTAGTLYTDTYDSGTPERPASPTPFPVNLNGWLTTTTSEITGPGGFVLSGGSMGPNGVIKQHIRTGGNLTGNKTFRAYAGATAIGVCGPHTTNPNAELLLSTRNQGSQSLQYTSRNGALAGVGVIANVVTTAESTAVDFSVDQTLSISLQLGANTACAVLMHADITCTYGA